MNSRFTPIPAARLRAALRDPGLLVEDPRAATAAEMVRRSVLTRMAARLAEERLPVLLWKGAALADSHYPAPWQREMSDMDCLVLRRDGSRVVAALLDDGFEQLPPPPDRRRSAELFEARLLAPGGALVVEVHQRVDKLGHRPVDHAGILQRAQPHPAHRSFLVPEDADHMLLVLLHAGVSEFRHTHAWLDLALLSSRAPAWDTIVDRAARWGLATLAYLGLSGLAEIEPRLVPAAVLDALRPSALRLQLLDWAGFRAVYPVVFSEERGGTSWLLRQGLLQDDWRDWSHGASRYAWARLRDRLV
ncbi:MAG: nucleotidyltransferase family protein [Polyangiaceae bacterium]